MKAVVTGGAGYVGSHVVRALVEAGHEVLVLDDLSTGFHDSLPARAAFERLDILLTPLLSAALKKTAPDIVVHMAGRIAVGESVREPAEYYRVNVEGGLSLLRAMREAGVGRVVFSSSAAIYGPPETVPIPENHPKNPTSPYGRTKWMFEQILTDFSSAYGMGAVSLRYFNAAGAHPSGETGERHEPETHLVPLCLRAAATGTALSLFGTDYPTRDGTAVRDYIHVWDLARAHVAACERCRAGEHIPLNCGTGRGFTVKEVIETCGKVTGISVPFEEAPRRPGDSPELVASAEKMRRTLEFEPERSTLEQIVEDAWRFHKAHSGWGARDALPDSREQNAGEGN